MIITKKHLSRRAVLRGTGMAMTLPLLDAMIPAFANAAAAPVRYLALYFPCGTSGAWMPSGSGTNWTAGAALKPLESVREDVSVLTGVGTGISNFHTGMPVGFTTGVVVPKTGPIKAGISIDQAIANHVGKQTKIKVITTSPPGTGRAANGQSGIYGSNISWVNTTTPADRTTSPKRLFDRIVKVGNGGGSVPVDNSELEQQAAEQKAKKLSVLDFVATDTARLMKKLGNSDKARIDQYLTNVREIEESLKDEELDVPVLENVPPTTCGAVKMPATGNHAKDTKAKLELIALAFHCNATRVATHLLDFDPSERNVSSYGIGVSGIHHPISHFGGNPTSAGAQKLDKIVGFYAQQLADLVRKMRSLKEAGGSVIDNSMIVWASGHNNGHNHTSKTDIPYVVAGGGGGALNPGRLIKQPGRSKWLKLHVSALKVMGVPDTTFRGENREMPDL